MRDCMYLFITRVWAAVIHAKFDDQRQYNVCDHGTYPITANQINTV